MNPSSKYLLVEPKIKAVAPNIALMKFARWCELHDHDYQYVRGIVSPNITPDVILMSCVFSYHSKLFENTINHYLQLFPDAKITVGGVFPSLNPEWFKKWNGAVSVHKGLCPEIEGVPPKYDVNVQSEDENPYPRDKLVLYASRGCPNKCRFCAVPKVEGAMKPFESISGMLNAANMPYASSLVLFDNNFLVHPYFDRIIDELVDFGLPVDIHGLHAGSFTRHHAKRFAELKWGSQQGNTNTPYLRFSFDRIKYAENIRKALKYVVDYDIKATFLCYLLYNWQDSPDDFWERIQIAQQIVDDVGETIQLFPMRYEPLNALERSQYIGKHWNNNLLRGIDRICENTHRFLTISRSRALFNYIGHTKDEFFQNVFKMGTDYKYEIEKKPLIRSDEMTDLKFHPVAAIFPMMDTVEFESLKADIQKHGQLEKIWTHDGKIIDGRNRYLACRELGIEPKIKEWEPVNGVELLDFVISFNLQRRHLTASQKALVAVDSLPFYEEAAKNRLKLSQGRGKKKGREFLPHLNLGRSRDLAAQTFGVSGRYVGYAKQINATDPDLAQEIRDGKKTITEAIKIIKRDEESSTPRNSRKKYKFKNDIGLVRDDFYEWSQQHLKEDSIDLVMTEPHCIDADIFFWERLAEVSERILKPSGFLGCILWAKAV
jgi:peptidoglycan/xylan/chitin deacetylase (PgdA/CDA1 family)